LDERICRIDIYAKRFGGTFAGHADWVCDAQYTGYQHCFDPRRNAAKRWNQRMSRARTFSR
jgi:hypothetical protein